MTTDTTAPTNADRALAILRHASDTLADPDSWSQGAAARFADGRICAVDNPAATTWCVIGATELADAHDSRNLAGYPAETAADWQEPSPLAVALLLLTEALPMGWRFVAGGLMHYNDAPERAHSEILHLLARATAAAQRQAFAISS